MKVKCIIVDDEPLSQEIIENYIQNIPKIELMKKCNNAFEAAETLQNHDIQLIFLDINMPKLSGISFVKSLLNAPEIIFITAYPEFAVEGFEVEATDYILKPFSMERFMKAVNKALRKIASKQADKYPSQEHAYLIVKSGKKMHKIDYNEILYFNSIGDYVKVFVRNKVLITNDTLKSIEAHLPEQRFIRIHKSFIISISAIQYIEGNQVKIANELLPIGLTYKDKLIELLDKREM
jgi:DNA-binding LytR/AlgR family response regulator